jgi:imidazolonepropionase-like amidohydrolase
MASLNPAVALGVSHKTGSIEESKEADLIIVDLNDEIPRILKTFVSGKIVFSTC